MHVRSAWATAVTHVLFKSASAAFHSTPPPVATRLVGKGRNKGAGSVFALLICCKVAYQDKGARRLIFIIVATLRGGADPCSLEYVKNRRQMHLGDLSLPIEHALAEMSVGADNDFT